MASHTRREECRLCETTGSFGGDTSRPQRRISVEGDELWWFRERDVGVCRSRVVKMQVIYYDVTCNRDAL